ncbi:uncharacterized protein LOC119545996 [Drosophila subpulchrella]|uniref:uncharacterized protein LOC119545996 n=1 Tax=Drosophila subpulchrella TaxID=1486046 RepID=UPI0018A14BC2|nr:uncharacterized protein LOC119545996 [Drosophila subpulchrella]
MRLSLIICSLNVLSLTTGFPLEEENNCELLKYVNTDDSWSNIFNNVITSLEESINRASHSENCASHVEFLQSCLDRAKSLFSPKEKMQFVVEFIDYQKVHTKNEPARTYTYLEKTLINLFHKTVDKLRILSGRLIGFAEKIEEKLGRTIDRQNKFLFGN